MSRARDIEVTMTTTPVLAALDRAGVPKRDDDGRPIGPALRIAVLACERDELLEALERFAEWVERDRREPDKLLCHVASMRRSAFAASSDHQATPDEPGEGRHA